MKSVTFILITVLLAALVVPFQLAAQQIHYKFVDIPTLGGAAAIGQVDGTGISQFINNPGVVVGGAQTSMLDPSAPGCSDCFLIHAFRWEDDVVTDLGALADLSFSHATSVNARGWVTGGSFTAAIDPLTGGQTEHAVLWKDSEIIDLGTLPAGIESAGLYVKNSGEVVGFSTVDTKPDPFASIGLGPFPSATHAFIWKNGVIRDLGTLGGPDAFATAGGCNLQRDGLVAGASFTSSTPNPSGFPTLDPFLWKDGTMIDLGSLGGTFGVAQCANNRGQVIGQSNLAGDVDQNAFLWQDGNLADLRTLGGSFSVAFWLNNTGEAVGGADTTGDESFHATLWRNGQITDLGTLDDDCASRALAINSKNQIIGQSFNCDTNTLRAVLWEKGSVIDLNAAIPPNSSLQLVEPFNINDRGEIVGRGLPAGCDDGDVCGHIFLLIPCNDVEGQSCQDNAAISGLRDSASLSTSATPRARPYTTKNIVAQWRARLGQRYNMRTLATPQK